MNGKRKRKNNTLKDGRNVRKTIKVYGARGRREREARKRLFLASQLLILAVIVAALVILAFSKNVSFNLFGDMFSIEKYKTDNNSETAKTGEIIDLSWFTGESDNEQAGSEESYETPATVENADMSEAITPTSLRISWGEYASDGEYSICYKRCDNLGEHHGKNYTENKSMSMVDICTACNEDEKTYSLVRKVTGTDGTITGLDPATTYDIEIKDTHGAVIATETLTTEKSGYCDPFKAVDSFYVYSERNVTTGQVTSKDDPITVTMTAPKGCLGIEVKPIISADIYKNPDLTETLSTEQAGSSLHIMEDANGNYCYLSENGSYSVFVSNEVGGQGWINARTLLVDAAAIYSPENGVYGIAINRTNAYSSIFTTGGDAQAVDYNEDANTRYNAISTNVPSEFMNADGYNIIEGITGNILPNYGSREQMPVIWDLAMELKQCQKNALENNTKLMMYEGYRPLSSSQAISGSLSGYGYLAMPLFGTNLAQGYLTDQTYSVGFYIAQKSRHNRGIATDLTLMSFDAPGVPGSEIQMQTKMHTLDYRCNMAYNNWEADLLTDIMIGHGSHLEYLAVRSEWWHFQLKTERTDLYTMIDKYPYADFIF